MFSAKILCDSLSPAGVRLTTIEVTMPRIILAEFNTHRMFSRNSASSRAIPVEKRISMVEIDPFIPAQFVKNIKGMQALETITDSDAIEARDVWIKSLQSSIISARSLAKLGVHKQLANRLIEPFCWHTVICTATEWDNFWGLRRHKDAQPEIRKAAELMHEAYVMSSPKAIAYDDWHLPLIEEGEEFDLEVQGFDVRKVSAGRCARVSYLTHDGKRDPQADVDLSDRLVQSGHMSPLEHVARPLDIGDMEWILQKPGIVGVDRQDFDSREVFCANFRGWKQLRKTLPYESNFLERPVT